MFSTRVVSEPPPGHTQQEELPTSRITILTSSAGTSPRESSRRPRRSDLNQNSSECRFPLDSQLWGGRGLHPRLRPENWEGVVEGAWPQLYFQGGGRGAAL